MQTTKTYLLENLCCENCAAAIESEAASLSIVSAAKVDYAAKTITITFEGDEGEAFSALSSLVAEVDEDVIAKEM